MTQILATNLYKAAKATYRSTGVRKTVKRLPVLAHARLSIRDGRASITTSILNGEPLTETASARVVEEFETCVPMRAFRDWLGVVAKSKEVLRLSYDPRVNVLTIETDSRVTGTRSRTIFKCIDAAEFPPIH